MRPKMIARPVVIVGLLVGQLLLPVTLAGLAIAVTTAGVAVVVVLHFMEKRGGKQ